MAGQNHRAVSRLLELGRRKGYLLSCEIREALPDDPLNGRGSVVGVLAEAGIRVIHGAKAYRTPDRVEAVAGELSAGQAVAESPPDLARAGDPIRMYLREMGAVPLLDRHGELEIGRGDADLVRPEHVPREGAGRAG